MVEGVCAQVQGNGFPERQVPIVPIVRRPQYNRLYSWDDVTLSSPTLFPQTLTNTMKGIRLNMTLQRDTYSQDSKCYSSVFFECHEDTHQQLWSWIPVSTECLASNNTITDARQTSEKKKQVRTSRLTTIQVLRDMRTCHWVLPTFRTTVLPYFKESRSSKRTNIMVSRLLSKREESGKGESRRISKCHPVICLRTSRDVFRGPSPAFVSADSVFHLQSKTRTATTNADPHMVLPQWMSVTSPLS